jgi:hypothetical protein
MNISQSTKGLRKVSQKKDNKKDRYPKIMKGRE